MRVADLQVYELLPLVLGLDGGGCVFDRGTEADADEAEDGAVAFAYAEDVVLEVCARRACEVSIGGLIDSDTKCCTPHCLLLRVCRVLYCKSRSA